MYKIIYLQKALDDLDEIHLYIAQDSPKAADKMINNILDSIEGLLIFPLSGSSVNDRLDVEGDYRMLAVKPYLVFYRVIGEEVIIYRVLHSRRYHNALLD
ncbi:MAG: type II toxin-antitoxin system RelE/ParE family toxin [Defluviitaleaceae bacterium]|nr:type II toxin-antitoxin system RelE/ParE family toxin [Defluviitaleaceae bacterium]